MIDCGGRWPMTMANSGGGGWHRSVIDGDGGGDWWRHPMMVIGNRCWSTVEADDRQTTTVDNGHRSAFDGQRSTMVVNSDHQRSVIDRGGCRQSMIDRRQCLIGGNNYQQLSTAMIDDDDRQSTMTIVITIHKNKIFSIEQNLKKRKRFLVRSRWKIKYN